MNYLEIVKQIAEECIGTLESDDGVESAVDHFMEGLTKDVQLKADELANEPKDNPEIIDEICTLRILFGRFEIGTPNVVVMLEAKRTALIDSPAKLMAALTKACTEWLLTPAGKSAKEYAGHDFNIGDLSSYIGDRTITTIFHENGLYDLTITDFAGVLPYDTCLAKLWLGV